ncbi:MAG: diphosphate--fructose-6-phosphate 1-phosphotransferase [Verrucomicrobiota bacterium]
MVVHSGMPTAVGNASISGIVSEALNHPEIVEIYGGLNGMPGVLNEELIDLAEESQQNIRGLRHTPGAALGSSRMSLRHEQDFERMFQVLRAHDIRFLFEIGDHECLAGAQRLHELAVERGYDLRVVVVPKSMDNEIAGTDHCPGFGSAIKHLSTTVRAVSADLASLSRRDSVAFIETPGRAGGWLTAGATMAKSRERIMDDPPHLVYLPEVPFSVEKLFADIDYVLKKERFCIVALSEGLRDLDGNYLTEGSITETLGRPLIGSAGELLRHLTEEQMNLNASCVRLGSASRAAVHCASQADNEEAFRAGSAAVRAAVEGKSGKMITLIRGDGDSYTCETGLADLAELAQKIKSVPENWINEDGFSMTFQFYKYCLPLIQGEVELPYDNGSPRFIELNRARVQRQLQGYEMA